MTSITELVERLKSKTRYQQLPEPINDEEYEWMITDAIKSLYIDTGRTMAFSKDAIRYEHAELIFDNDLAIDEEKYVLLLAQIEFFKRVQVDVNNITSYTTNALSVTGADKPYAHLQDTIDKLESERRIVYYKMVRYYTVE